MVFDITMLGYDQSRGHGGRAPLATFTGSARPGREQAGQARMHAAAHDHISLGEDSHHIFNKVLGEGFSTR